MVSHEPEQDCFVNQMGPPICVRRFETFGGLDQEYEHMCCLLSLILPPLLSGCDVWGTGPPGKDTTAPASSLPSQARSSAMIGPALTALSGYLSSNKLERASIGIRMSAIVPALLLLQSVGTRPFRADLRPFRYSPSILLPLISSTCSREQDTKPNL